jgi:hypothetical protein
MKSLVLCSILGLTALPPKDIACDCNYNGSFMKVARGVEAVMLVRVTKYKPITNRTATASASAMEADVLKVYKGKAVKSTITIWGDDGMQCRPYVSAFTLGKEYVIALNTTSEGSANSTNYCVSICGEYWLSVNEKMQLVYGNIDSSIRLTSVTTLQKFEAELKKAL